MAKVNPLAARHGLARHHRKELDKPGLDRFTFLKNYRAVPGENPLISGKLTSAEQEAYNEKESQPAGEQRELLDLDLFDLVEAKKVFTESDSESGLSLTEFVAQFSRICGEQTRLQLGYLFMRIDCNSDGFLTWDEFLTYIMACGNARAAPLADDRLQKQLVKEPSFDILRSALHKDLTTHLLFVPICSTYVTAARDGTVRVWSQDLIHERTIDVSEKMVAIHSVTILPGLQKLVVATDDRQLIFYELLSHANAVRWALFGKLHLKELPISLAAWTHKEGTDSLVTECLAIGTEEGTVYIYDAKVLLRGTKGRGGEPLIEATLHATKALEAARIVPLQLHSDWVSQLAFHEGLGALVSAGLDGSVRLTALNWPPHAVPTHRDPSVRHTEFNAKQCRNLCTLRAHSKGVQRALPLDAGGKRLLATCGFERSASLWNLETADFVRTFDGHRSAVIDLSYDPNRQILFTLSGDGETRTWDLSNLSVVMMLTQVLAPEEEGPAAKDRTSTICFNPRSHCLVTADRRPGRWFYPSRHAPRDVLAARALAPHGHGHPLVGVLYAAHFFFVVSGDELGLICVWDIRSGALLFRFEHSCARLTTMQFDRSGRRLITGSADGSVRLWNFSSGELLRVISFDECDADFTSWLASPVEPEPEYSPRPFSPGSLTPGAPTTFSSEGAAPSTATASAAAPAAAPAPSDAAPFATYDPDDEQVADAGEVTGLLHIQQGPYSYYASVGWSRTVYLWPDADRDASGGKGRTVRKLEGHTDDVLSLAFCPPTLLCTGAYDGTIIVWNLVSGSLKLRLAPPPSSKERMRLLPSTARLTYSQAIESLVFLETSCSLLRDMVLVSASADGALRFWDARSGRLLVDYEDAAALGESLHHVASEETNTFLLTGDSAGVIKVWDISDLVEQSVHGRPLSQAHVRVLFSWKAHLRAVVQLEYLKGVEGIVSASTDCTVRLWSLSGEQIGVFGQAGPWTLTDHNSWLDDDPAKLRGRPRVAAGNSSRLSAVEVPEPGAEPEPDDKTAVSELRLQQLLPNGGRPLEQSGTSASRGKEHKAALDEQQAVKEALCEARTRSRGQSAHLAQKSTVALKPPEWRIAAGREGKPHARIDDRRAASAAHLLERKHMLSASKAKVNAASHIEVLKPLPSTPPRYAGGGRGPWGAAGSTKLSHMRTVKSEMTLGTSYEPLGVRPGLK